MAHRPACRAILAALAALPLWLAAPAPAADPGAATATPGAGLIAVEGRRLIAADGTPFAIRGIALGNWLMPEGYMFKFKRHKSPRAIAGVIEALIGPDDAREFWRIFRDRYVTRADIALIRRAGFNTVRVPLHYGLFLAQHDPYGADADQPPRFDGPGWALLDRVIGWCREEGLRVIIDLHAAPGGQTGVNHDDGVGYPLVFYVPREQRRTEALWLELARRYRGDPTVLGYELLNEPISTYSDLDTLNPALEPFYRRLTTAIRAVDPDHILFLPAPQWGQTIGVFGPPFAANLVYVYHQFWSTTGPEAIQDYINFANRYQAAILVGEAGEASDQWNDEFRRLNERFGFGWSFWTYKNLDTPSTAVSIVPPPGWDRIARAGSIEDPTPAKVGLDRAGAKAILWAYLDALTPDRARINQCYLDSLTAATLPAACRERPKP